MKILMVHPHDIFSDFEPWTVRITYLAKELTKRGHQVTLVYFPLNSVDLPPVIMHEGMTIIPLSRKANPLILIRNIKKLKHLLDTADIVHFQKCFHFCAVPVTVAAWLANKPIHYDWDDWEAKIYYLGGDAPSRITGFFLNTVESFLPQLVDTISVASAELRRIAIKRGFPEKRIFDAPVGADLTTFHPGVSSGIIKERYAIRGPLVIYVGQLHGGQYAHLFIRAAAIVAREHPRPHVTFMIVGGGHNEGKLRQLIADLNLEGSVLITGLVPHKDVPLYMAAGDIAVACFEENDITKCKSPLKIVEYLAAGKAIIASEVGETGTMLKGVGVLVPPGNEYALAGEILRLLVNPELRRHLGNKARLRAEEKYNWTVTAHSLINAYDTALFINNKRERNKYT